MMACIRWGLAAAVCPVRSSHLPPLSGSLLPGPLLPPHPLNCYTAAFENPEGLPKVV